MIFRLLIPPKNPINLTEIKKVLSFQASYLKDKRTIFQNILEKFQVILFLTLRGL